MLENFVVRSNLANAKESPLFPYLSSIWVEVNLTNYRRKKFPSSLIVFFSFVYIVYRGVIVGSETRIVWNWRKIGPRWPRLGSAKTHRFAWFATSGIHGSDEYSVRDNRLRREESAARWMTSKGWASIVRRGKEQKCIAALRNAFCASIFQSLSAGRERKIGGNFRAGSGLLHFVRVLSEPIGTIRRCERPRGRVRPLIEQRVVQVSKR